MTLRVLRADGELADATVTVEGEEFTTGRPSTPSARTWPASRTTTSGTRWPADVDGDGYDDALVYNDPADLDHVRILPGPLADVAPGAALLTLGAADASNWSFSVGDVNGDGLADLAYGVAGDTPSGPNSGRAAFFLGPLAGARDYADADGTLDAEDSQLGLARGLRVGAHPPERQPPVRAADIHAVAPRLPSPVV